jgi:hypothetical protein
MLMHAITGIDRVMSNLYIFVVFNSKESHIMAASIYGASFVFELVLKLISAVCN